MTRFTNAYEKAYEKTKANSPSAQRLVTVNAEIKEFEAKLNETIDNQVRAIRTLKTHFHRIWKNPTAEEEFHNAKKNAIGENRGIRLRLITIRTDHSRDAEALLPKGAGEIEAGS